jgi:Uma2 family endonuclease
MSGRARVRFKAGDIWDVPDDNLRYEVIDGDLFMAPAPGWSHQYALAELHVALHNWVRRYRLGHVVEAPFGVILDGETAVQPDLVYVSNNRAGIITERAVQGAPDLVVEVLSPSTEARDRGGKMRRYATAGVLHYWLIDLQRRAVESYELVDDGYRLSGTYGPTGVIRPVPFPGLGISVDSLWSA